jgi:hypothetical protein
MPQTHAKSTEMARMDLCLPRRRQVLGPALDLPSSSPSLAGCQLRRAGAPSLSQEHGLGDRATPCATDGTPPGLHHTLWGTRKYQGESLPVSALRNADNATSLPDPLLTAWVAMARSRASQLSPGASCLRRRCTSLHAKAVCSKSLQSTMWGTRAVRHSTACCTH